MIPLSKISPREDVSDVDAAKQLKLTELYDKMRSSGRSRVPVLVAQIALYVVHEPDVDKYAQSKGRRWPISPLRTPSRNSLPMQPSHPTCRSWQPGGRRGPHPSSEFALARWAAANLTPEQRTEATVYSGRRRHVQTTRSAGTPTACATSNFARCERRRARRPGRLDGDGAGRGLRPRCRLAGGSDGGGPRSPHRPRRSAMTSGAGSPGSGSPSARISATSASPPRWRRRCATRSGCSPSRVPW
jgi:hypothetical protein